MDVLPGTSIGLGSLAFIIALPVSHRPVVLFVLLAFVAGCAGSRHARRAATMGVEWLPVPGGPFVMGDTFFGTNTDALPVHEVTVGPFLISRNETTRGQYRVFASATGVPMPEGPASAPDDMAVSSVDWDEANAFCAWIGGRLPSEQEWEFAAAGGPDKQLYAGTDNVDSLASYARFRANSVARPAPVGRRLPNRFGLHDMSGNVAEWVGAFYQFYPKEGLEPVVDDPKSTGIRIVRGGSYSMEPDVTRTYWRAGTLRSVRSSAVGFRCAKDR